MDTTPPNITSFVIRFIHGDLPGSSPPDLRGSIRHIQTDQEIAFTRWVDAVDFIRRYVTIEDEE
jgi:hypothetical protein